MYIKSLRLINFRNYDDVNIEFSKRFNIIYGENAQGKTNILESLFLCASGRSHRTSRDVELIKFGEQAYFINVIIEKEKREKSIQIGYRKNERKNIKINEVPVKKIGNLMGNLNVVMFSPEDLMMIKEGPSERRRFIDITLSQLKPSYFYELQQYAKIIYQRNILLKELQENKKLMDTLDIWDYNLVKSGSKIVKERKEFIEKLKVIAEKNHYKITDGTEKLGLKYICSFKIDDCNELEEIEESFKRTLKKISQRELFKGTTMIGPQRDDCEILLNDANIKQYGSQGQQRSAVLSMKLSEIDIMMKDSGHYPVLLLDDVMSELDLSRQTYLFNSIENIQTFITCTDKCFFEEKGSKETQFFRIKMGKIGYDIIDKS